MQYEKDPQQKILKLCEKWKVCDKIKETINTCVDRVTEKHNYIDEADYSTDSIHDVAFVYEKDWGQEYHEIHLYTKYFEQSSQMSALTLVHEMTHDNTETDDIDQMTPQKIHDNYQPMRDKIAKNEDIDEQDIQDLMIYMTKKYPEEMKEALESTPVIEKFKDENAHDFLKKFQSALTNNIAETFWEELSEDELQTLVTLHEDVLCVHISMDKACLVEFFPKEAANDAECIARFAYDCYKHKQGI